MSQAYPSPILIVPGHNAAADIDKIVDAIRNQTDSTRGLSKRELIAAMCMATLTAVINTGHTPEDDADTAVDAADTLLAALAKETP